MNPLARIRRDVAGIPDDAVVPVFAGDLRAVLEVLTEMSFHTCAEPCRHGFCRALAKLEAPDDRA